MVPLHISQRRLEADFVFVIWQDERQMWEAIRRIKQLQDKATPGSQRTLNMFPSRSPEEREVSKNMKKFMGLFRQLATECGVNGQAVTFETEWKDGNVYIVHNEKYYHVYKYSQWRGHGIEDSVLLQLIPGMPVQALKERMLS